MLDRANQCAPLQSLHIRTGNYDWLSSESVAAIASHADTLRTLKLELGHAPALKEMNVLCGLTNLRELYISGQVSTASLIGLVSLHKLEDLGLCLGMSPVEVGERFVSLLAQIPSLKRVHIVRAKMNETNVARLRQALPRLEDLEVREW